MHNAYIVQIRKSFWTSLQLGNKLDSAYFNFNRYSSDNNKVGYLWQCYLLLVLNLVKACVNLHLPLRPTSLHVFALSGGNKMQSRASLPFRQFLLSTMATTMRKPSLLFIPRDSKDIIFR